MILIITLLLLLLLRKDTLLKNLKLPLIRNSFSNRINIFSSTIFQNSKKQSSIKFQQSLVEVKTK